MGRRIEKEPLLARSASEPETLEILETRRAQHERLIRGKPEKAFGEFLDEKMGRGGKKRRDSEEDDTQGAKDPLLGLSPGQTPSLANGSKGRRAGRVIIKG